MYVCIMRYIYTTHPPRTNDLWEDANTFWDYHLWVSASKMSLLIIGHSFVRQLHVDGVELSDSMSATFRDVSIEGIRGGSVEHLRGKLSITERTSPSVVLIDVGTNELSSPSVNPRCLACEIGEIARRFRQLPSVETVVIMPILPRVVVDCRYPTRPDFNDGRLVVNREVTDIYRNVSIRRDKFQ